MRISDWSSDVCSSDLETPQCCPDGRNRLVIGGGLWRHAGACSARLRQSPTSVPYDEAEGRGDNRSPMAANDVRGLVSIWLYHATHDVQCNDHSRPRRAACARMCETLRSRSEGHTSELQS